MSLSISQLEFITEQQAIALAARDIPLIQQAKDQLTAIFAQLPVGEQFPFKDFTAMLTLKELNEFKDMLLMIHNITGRPAKIPRNLLAHWPISLIPALEPEIMDNLEIINRKADKLLEKLTTEYPQAISFHNRVPFVDTAAYRTLKSLHDQSLTIPNIVDDKGSKKVNFEVTLQKWKENCSSKGANHSLLSTMSETTKAVIKSNLTTAYPVVFRVYERISYLQVPENIFLKFLLLYMDESREQDKLDVINQFTSLKMEKRDDYLFDHNNYEDYLGKFLNYMTVYAASMKATSAKTFSTMFANGLTAGTFKEEVKVLASTVDNDPRAFYVFLDEVNKKAESLR